jgi:hypothetical protein
MWLPCIRYDPLPPTTGAPTRMTGHESTNLADRPHEHKHELDYKVRGYVGLHRGRRLRGEQLCEQAHAAHRKRRRLLRLIFALCCVRPAVLPVQARYDTQANRCSDRAACCFHGEAAACRAAPRRLGAKYLWHSGL